MSVIAAAASSFGSGPWCVPNARSERPRGGADRPGLLHELDYLKTHRWDHTLANGKRVIRVAARCGPGRLDNVRSGSDHDVDRRTHVVVVRLDQVDRLQRGGFG